MADFNRRVSLEKKSKNPLFVSIGIILGLVFCYFFIPVFQESVNQAWDVLTSNDEARINNWVQGFGWMGPVVIVLAMILQMFLIVIPTTILMVVTIVAYPVWGSLIAIISISVASTVGYFIGKYIGSGIVTRLLGEKTENNIAGFVEDYGFWAVAIIRINPFLSDDAVSFVAGILKMPYWKFMAATLAGVAPLIIFILIMGEYADSLSAGLFWGSLISLVLFGGFVWWDKRRKR